MAPIGEPRSAVLHLGGFERHRRGKALLEEAVVQLQRSEIFLLENQSLGNCYNATWMLPVPAGLCCLLLCQERQLTPVVPREAGAALRFDHCTGSGMFQQMSKAWGSPSLPSHLLSSLTAPAPLPLQPTFPLPLGKPTML